MGCLLVVHSSHSLLTSGMLDWVYILFATYCGDAILFKRNEEPYVTSTHPHILFLLLVTLKCPRAYIIVKHTLQYAPPALSIAIRVFFSFFNFLILKK